MGALREFINLTRLLSSMTNFLGFTNILVASKLLIFTILRPKEFDKLSMLYDVTSCKNKISAFILDRINTHLFNNNVFFPENSSHRFIVNILTCCPIKVVI